MKKFRLFIILGICALVASITLLVLGFALYPDVMVTAIKEHHVDISQIWIILVFLALGSVLGEGGLFLVIFFSIRGKLLDKRNKEVVDVKSTEK